MINLITNFLTKHHLQNEDMFNPSLNEELKEYLDNYYRITLPPTINNIKELEIEIYNLVSPRSIMFHYFHNDHVKQYGQGSISDKQLDELIHKIGRANILDVDEWLDKFNDCTLKKGEVCFTIDDGLKNQFNVALPVLYKYNIKAGWYIYTNPINKKYEILDIYKYFCGNYYESYESFYEAFFNIFEHEEFERMKKRFLEEDYLSDSSFYTYNDRLFRYIRDVLLPKTEFEKYIFTMIKDKNIYVADLIQHIWMSETDVLELSKTQLIGLHSTSHPTRMDKLTHEDQLYEYVNNKNKLEEIIGKTIYTTSYPCGRYNDDTFAIQKQINIKYAFISYLEQIALDEKNMRIQRIDSIDAITEYLV